MSKAVIGGVVGVVAAAAAVVGGAAWSGQATQRRLEDEVAKLQTVLPLKVVESRYEKGLFSATQTVVLKPGCEGDDAEETKGLTLRNHIQHGPLPGFTRIGWSAVDTELEMPEELRDLLKDAPQSLVSAHTVIGLGGGFQSRVSTPVLDFKENAERPGQARVESMVLHASGSAKAMTYDLAWSGLSAALTNDNADTQVKLGNFTLRGDMVRDEATPLWLAAGKAQSQWDRLEVSHTPKQPDEKPTKVVFSNLQGSGEATLENGLLSRSSRLQAEGQVNDVKLSKINLAASLKRLHVATYAKLMQQSTGPALCRSHDPAQAEAALALMGGLLPHNPEISLDKFELEVDGQPGEISYALGTQGVTAEEAANPEELRTVLFAKAYANGQARVPLAWIERVMIDSQPDRQAQDRAMLDAMLTQAVDSGYVVRDGQVLNSQFKLDKGQLLVNGKALGPLAHVE